MPSWLFTAATEALRGGSQGGHEVSRGLLSTFNGRYRVGLGQATQDTACSQTRGLGKSLLSCNRATDSQITPCTKAARSGLNRREWDSGVELEPGSVSGEIADGLISKSPSLAIDFCPILRQASTSSFWLTTQLGAAGDTTTGCA